MTREYSCLTGTCWYPVLFFYQYVVPNGTSVTIVINRFLRAKPITDHLLTVWVAGYKEAK